MSSTTSRLESFTGQSAIQRQRVRRGALATLRHWFQVARERRELVALDDHALRDIGLTRADVIGEYDRHFWDVSPRR